MLTLEQATLQEDTKMSFKTIKAVAVRANGVEKLFEPNQIIPDLSTDVFIEDVILIDMESGKEVEFAAGTCINACIFINTHILPSHQNDDVDEKEEITELPPVPAIPWYKRILPKGL